MSLKNSSTLFFFLMCLCFVSGLEKLHAQGTLVNMIDDMEKDSLSLSKISIKVGGQLRLIGIYDFNALQEMEAFNILSIPTGSSYNTSNRFSLDVGQSRFSTSITYHSQKLGDVKSYFEGDFFGDGLLDFRLRFFYIDLKNFTFGQTWSVFCDDDAWPDIVDFDGPPTGLWARTAQVRYTHYFNDHNKIAVAIESPQTDITTIHELDSTIVETYQGCPDITAHWNVKQDWGHFQLAGIYRRFYYIKDGQTLTNNAGGVLVSGHVNTRTKDKLIVQATVGSGIASYLVSFMGGGYDAVTTAEDELSNIPVFGGFAAYELWLQHNLKTVLVYGHTHMTADVEGITNDDFWGNYASATLWWFLDDKLTFGIEALHGNVDDFYSQTGHASRLQGMFMFNF